MTKSGASLISKLLHDYEGEVGNLVANAIGAPTTQSYVWKNYGDGSLRLNQLNDPDNLIYYINANGNTIQAALLSAEPIQWSQYMPAAPLATGANLRRFDLIVGLAAVSTSDVFRHMAQNSSNATSAQGQGNNGLLGYILERVPFALPIETGLSSLNISSNMISALMKAVFTLQSGATSAPDYSTTELGARLMSDNYTSLWNTYQSLSPFVKGWPVYVTQQDFIQNYCVGKFDASSSNSSTAFEKSWVTAQIANLQNLFGTSGSARSTALIATVPSVITGTHAFASTLVLPYSIPIDPNTNKPLAMPPEWVPAIPPGLMNAFLSNPNGVWGIE